MTKNAKEIWELARWFYEESAEHQVDHTEDLFKIKGTHIICWICGQETDLRYLIFRTRNGVDIEALHCVDCTDIQQDMGLNITSQRKVKESRKIKCPDCNGKYRDINNHIETICKEARQRAIKFQGKLMVYHFVCIKCEQNFSYPSGSESSARSLISNYCISCQRRIPFGLIAAQNLLGTDLFPGIFD